MNTNVGQRNRQIIDRAHSRGTPDGIRGPRIHVVHFARDQYLHIQALRGADNLWALRAGLPRPMPHRNIGLPDPPYNFLPL